MNISKGVDTAGFKVWVLVYVFFLTFFRLFETRYSPITIIPDRVVLGTVLFSLVYIWLQEVKDRQTLQQANLRLLEKQDELKQSNIDTVTSLVLSEEAKDPYTHGHSERVKEFSLKIADRLSLPARDMQVLERACLLHDLGKIGIPDSILHKSERLSQEEWEEIKSHPSKANRILTPLQFLPQERLIILHHHEHYDGSGYPNGLKGAEIPLGARILAVADAYDAMNSQRPYRQPLPKEKIIEEFTKNSGTQFDPQIAKVLVSLVKDNLILNPTG